jgi:EAL domain-containing protein (putative c-di-GMP-specific phosphodiesterase class I)
MAGLAMSEARTSKRPVYYDRDLINEASTLRAREIDFATALRNQTLSLYAQPQVSAEGEIHGVEMLTRWKHSSEGFIGPDKFIPMAERLGLIGYLGSWVLRTSCQTMIEWDKKGFKIPGRVAINVSTLQLKEPNFAREFLAIIHGYNIDANRLEIEITESSTLGEGANAKEQLDRLSTAGVRIAIDDFGTGYSSLSYFNALPISLLKIDQSFVRDMDSRSGVRLVRTIVNMAFALQVQVLAEGVETESQRRQLKKLGCHAFQGFLFGAAMPLEQLPDWVEQFNKAPSIS